MQNLGRGIIQFGDAIVEVLTPFVGKVREFGIALFDACWTAYREAGMPYGETEADMMRWIAHQSSEEATSD